jgi:hypothetical protein
MKKTYHAPGVSKTRSLTRQLFLPVALIAGGLATASTAQAALVFQMDFNDVDGNQSLTDRGTTGVTGTMSGGTTYSTDVASVNGGGYSASFDGVSGVANFGDINAVDGLSTITMTAWIKSSTSNVGGSSGSGRIVSKRASNNSFELYYHNPDSELEFVANAAPVVNGGGSFAGQAWTWVAVTYDSGAKEASFYTGNGTTLSAADTVTLDHGDLGATTASLLIGNVAAGNRTFSGLIDNVRIYNSVEDAASLASIMTFDDAAAIPEPSSAALLLGLCGLTLTLQRRRRR